MIAAVRRWRHKRARARFTREAIDFAIEDIARRQGRSS